MLKSGRNRMFRMAFLLVAGLLGLFFFLWNSSEMNTKSKASNVSSYNPKYEGKSEFQDSVTPSRKDSFEAFDSVIKQEKHEIIEQNVNVLEKNPNFNTANTKPFFKVGPGSVKKLSTEKPEQSNPFNTGVEPSSSDRLPTITVDDESVPAIFSSSQNPNDCESQTIYDSLPEIDLLHGELKVTPVAVPDSTIDKTP